MTALNDINHTAVGHIVNMVRVETHRRTFAAGVHRNVDHGLLLVGIQLLHGEEGKARFGLLARQCKPAGISPALGDTVGHCLWAFGRKGRITWRIVAQMARSHINGTAADDRPNAKQHQSQNSGMSFHARYATPALGAQQPAIADDMPLA